MTTAAVDFIGGESTRGLFKGLFMTTKKKALVGIVVLAVVGVVAVVFLVPGEVMTRVVAALSFIIAVGKTLYDVWDKERERRKKSDESRERVKATAKYGYWDSTGEELGVVLYNEGANPVHIQAVTCHFIPNDGAEEVKILLRNMGNCTSELVQPKHVAKFRFGMYPDLLRMLTSLAETSVWITVNSYQGDICRVDGDEIIKVLKSRPTHQGS